jgi:hypothetical protein
MHEAKSAKYPLRLENYRLMPKECQRKWGPRLCRVPTVFRTWFHQVGAKIEGFRLPLLGGACAPPS